MHGGHLNDEREEVVNDSVEESVEEHFLRHVLHRLQSVVYVELGRHLDEAEGVDGSHERVDHKGVPPLVLIVQQRVDRVPYQHWEQCVGHVPHGRVIILFGFTLDVGFFVVEGEVGEGVSLSEFGGSFELPAIEEDAEAAREDNEVAGFVVEEVEEDDDGHPDLDVEALHRDPFHRVLVLPERNVVLERQHLEHRVQQRHNHRNPQQDRIRLNEHALDVVDVAGVDAPGGVDFSLGCELLLEDEVVHGEGVEVERQVQLRQRLVYEHKVLLQDPKIAQIYDGEVGHGLVVDGDVVLLGLRDALGNLI
mmetsp:Transcript_35459/g.34496  ORF Transcript_35459/g.34496 Transcript_35459/m.34496 type:complete len:307 (-) Transcript_35459:717-1637(-)